MFAALFCAQTELQWPAWQGVFVRLGGQHLPRPAGRSRDDDWHAHGPRYILLEMLNNTRVEICESLTQLQERHPTSRGCILTVPCCRTEPLSIQRSTRRASTSLNGHASQMLSSYHCIQSHCPRDITPAEPGCRVSAEMRCVAFVGKTCISIVSV